MHTRELLRRLVRLTASRELDSAPVEVLAELIDYANEALIEVWLRMPAELRKLPVTQPLRAPTSVEVAPYHGGRFVGTTLVDWIGCAIQLPDDPLPNRLVSENALERPHNGNPANDGVSATALVWHDAVHIPESATMLQNGVFVECGSRHLDLHPWPHMIPMWAQMDVSPGEPCWYSVRQPGFTAPSLDDPLARTAGMPDLVDPPPGWWLHVLPRPSAAAVLRFTLNVQGERITASDYRRNKRLLVPDRISTHVARLAAQKLLASRLFVGDDDLRRGIETEAERARMELRTLIDSQVEYSGSYGTPATW